MEVVSLEQAVHDLHGRVVIRVKVNPDRRLDAFQGQVLGVPTKGVPRSCVDVSDQIAR